MPLRDRCFAGPALLVAGVFIAAARRAAPISSPALSSAPDVRFVANLTHDIDTMDCDVVQSKDLQVEDCAREDVLTSEGLGVNRTQCVGGSACHKLCEESIAEGWFGVCVWQLVAHTAAICPFLDDSGMLVASPSWGPSEPSAGEDDGRRKLSLFCGKNAICYACSDQTQGVWDSCATAYRSYLNLTQENRITIALAAVEPASLRARCDALES